MYYETFNTFTNFRSISLFESLIISDGLINGVSFVKNYLHYKLREDVLDKLEKKTDLLKSYNNLYNIDVFDRYIVYLTLYICHYLFMIDIVYLISLLFTLPIIQNSLLLYTNYNVYKENKKIFVKYLICKYIIDNIKRLDKGVSDIKNYHIFLLYNVISLKMIFEWVKSYTFIYVLDYLKSDETTYYYYKMIKLAYYYSHGYLFNVLSKRDAVYILNVVISDKRWGDISKLEIVNAFYHLIHVDKKHILTDIKIYFIKFFTLWSAISFFKILHARILILCYLLLILLNTMSVNVTFSHPKQYIILTIVFGLLLLNNHIINI